jgi:superfamily II DNA/RNA helicase
MDELLTWAPDDLLGDLVKIDASLKPFARLQTIERWYHDGGVLIIGYEMFRDFVSNQLSRKGQIDPEKWDQVRKQLLEGPNVIIADEAHKLKNATAAVTLAASQFKSKTRIALTGSPLANNVEEYHTMIEWVAPNYLGPITEFRAKYKEPIEQGLYIDSTSQEKRRSLKMLNVLKEDLSPKVNRADMSVLRGDLPPKKEFVIMCSLTELQKQAYITYVRSMSASNNIPLTKSGEVKVATMWSYLGVLSLLCNHPYCFKAKLEERVQDARQNSTVSAIAPADAQEITDEDDLLESNEWKAGATEDLITQEQQVFRSVHGDLKSIELSNKVKILCQILDASKAVGDKVLVFSQTIPTLNFLQDLCMKQGRKFSRLDGKTAMKNRQGLTKKFNSNEKDLFLISTTAGGLGLNLFGANRVVIFDFRYNPIHEEQAIGRAYRIGQTKTVFVYRLLAAGTFEDSIHNTAIFKTQLAFRVVDKKNPIAWAQKGLGKFLHEPKDVEQKDLSKFHGMDPAVLDKILGPAAAEGTIRSIVQSDTFEEDDKDGLTEKEQQEVRNLLKLEQLKRTDPKAYQDHLRTQASAGSLPGQQRIREQEALRIQKSMSHSATAIPSASGSVPARVSAQNTKAAVPNSELATGITYMDKQDATTQNVESRDAPEPPVGNRPGSPVPERVLSDPAIFVRSSCNL